ncbi:MAG: hypothetical protein NTW19_17775 [Planctomycetota bacterium]|nr:hypothetical protein [Planctomycetota bacterium]
MTRLRAVLLFAALALWLGQACGCASSPASQGLASGGRDKVDVVSLYGLPVPFSIEGAGAPVSFQIGVLFFRRDEPQALRVRSGVVEFFLYEGRFRPADAGEAKPFQTWRLTAAEIEPYAVFALPGWGYQLALPLAGKAPTTRVVTLLARFRAAQGDPVDSEPMLLQMHPG